MTALRAFRLHLLAFLALMLAPTGATAAPVHRCASHALEQAERLLKFATENEEHTHAGQIDGAAIKLTRPMKDPVDGRKLDVLEVHGNDYKTSYRIRLLYMRIPSPGNCVLRGQEILQVTP